MIRAVFIDYMGTLVKEDNPYVQEVIGRCFTRDSIRADVQGATNSGITPWLLNLRVPRILIT
jgi:hypothetical protein